MPYNPELRNRVLQGINIVDIISPVVNLTPSGNGKWSGICPFHADHNPSFSVDEERQSYFCWGCKEKGNAIDFLIKSQGLSFSQALRVLQDQAGLGDLTSHEIAMMGIASICERLKKDAEEENEFKSSSGGDIVDLMQMISDVCRETLVEDPGLLERMEGTIFMEADEAFDAGDLARMERIWHTLGDRLEEVKRGEDVVGPEVGTAAVSSEIHNWLQEMSNP